MNLFVEKAVKRRNVDMAQLAIALARGAAYAFTGEPEPFKKYLRDLTGPSVAGGSQTQELQSRLMALRRSGMVKDGSHSR